MPLFLFIHRILSLFSEVRVWDGRKEREGEGKEICRSDFWNILIERVEWKGSYN